MIQGKDTSQVLTFPVLFAALCMLIGIITLFIGFTSNQTTWFVVGIVITIVGVIGGIVFVVLGGSRMNSKER